MSAVDMATFALYISLFTTPIETLVNSTETFQKAIAASAAWMKCFRARPDIEDAPDARPLKVSAGAIEYAMCASATRIAS